MTWEKGQRSQSAGEVAPVHLESFIGETQPECRMWRDTFVSVIASHLLAGVT